MKKKTRARHESRYARLNDKYCKTTHFEYNNMIIVCRHSAIRYVVDGIHIDVKNMLKNKFYFVFYTSRIWISSRCNASVRLITPIIHKICV